MELLVRNKDHSDFIPPFGPGRFRKGDIIHAAPDGHPWSAAERSHPDWTILELPGLDPAEAVDLLAPGDKGPVPAGMAPLRAKYVDFDALGQGHRPAIAAFRAAIKGRSGVHAPGSQGGGG